ncbi:MAG: DUF2071 domain-containing protein [Gemmatimonadaceae bacterium]|nr:DUF2071 domain-containing protein [Gemmatimonadaceae bacterium]
MSIVSKLQRHLFAVDAHFDRVVALSFAFPEALVRPLVPRALTLDTYEGLAFVTVAMVWTRALRPAGLPSFLGRSFFLAGYRVFTRLQEPDGRRLRGLRILRSNTDRRSMVWLGNLFTAYNYRHVRVDVSQVGTETHVATHGASREDALQISFDDTGDDIGLPVGSPFVDWKSARRFAGPMPFTFSPEDDRTMVVIEGSRQHWEPRPVHVSAWTVGFFDATPFAGTTPVLANAFTVRDVAYRWQPGRLVHTTGESM